MKYILHIPPDSSGILAVRAIKSFEKNGKGSIGGYGYSDGTFISVRRNKTSITAYESTGGIFEQEN